MSRPGRPDRPNARPTRPGAGRGAPVAPVPLEKGRARGVLGGLFLFAAGFAAGAMEFLLTGVAGPAYLLGISVGLAGIGIVGFFLNRGTVPRPEEAIWKPLGLRPWISALGLPVTAVTAVFYTLLLVGVVGNFVVPVFFRR